MYGSTGDSAGAGQAQAGPMAQQQQQQQQREALLGAAHGDGALRGSGSGDEGDEDAPVSGHKNNLGVFNGVFVPCLLNILGVILFLRIGWGVSHAGWLGVVLMFVVGETLALLTVFSMAAIVSNGNMRGGGSYYLISRSLGAEFGGSVGLLFYSAYAVGTSFYVVGFASEIIDAFFADEDLSEDRRKMYNVIIASIALAFVMLISYLGAGFFTKINGIVFAIQFGSIIIGIASMFFASPIAELENGGSFDGFSLKRLKDNMWTDFTADDKCGRGAVCSARSVFGILFPAMTGIMEGANLSGDLKNPNRDIGRGTIAAVFGAITTYLFLIFGFAGAFPRDTLKTNMNVMANVTWPSKYITIIGISVSAFSSALGSVFGGSRVLQALGRDDLPPKWGLSFFAKGSKKGDEPRRAVLFTWLIAQMACLAGDLDVISPIIASFFLLSYATVNLTCLLLDLSGTPNFRPHFRMYSRKQSGTGFALCMFTLFFLDVWYGVIAVSFLLLLFIYISYKAPAKAWGDVSQSIMYHQVRKYLLRLDAEHPKNWRPSMLLLLGPGRLNTRVVDFCNSLKKGGLYCIGDGLVGNVETAGEEVSAVRSNWTRLIKELNIKAVPEVTFAPSLREAFQQIVLMAGVGGMRPNCVALQLPTVFDKVPEHTPARRERRHALRLRANSMVGPDAVDLDEIPVFEHEEDFCNVLRDIVHVFRRNVLLACNFGGMSDAQRRHQQHLERSANAKVDVYVIGTDLTMGGTLSLMLQLAHILRLERASQLRILNIVDEHCDVEAQEAEVSQLAAQARLFGATAHVIALRGARPLDALVQEGSRADFEDLNRVIASNAQQDRDFVSLLHTLVHDLPPVVFVRAAQLASIIPEEL